MRIIAYIRVSSTAKADHEDSAAGQLRKIRAWAKQHGHRVTAVCSDEGVSGAGELSSRIALPEALALLRSRQAGGLVVTKLDRLSRDMILQEQLLAEIRRCGGEPFTVSAAEQAFLADDSEDPSRALIRRILGAVSQYERDMTVLRLRGGKRVKRAAGGYVPMGVQVASREFVPVEAEQATLRRLRELRAAGRSLREICAQLEAEGCQTKHGARWHPSTVSRYLAA